MKSYGEAVADINAEAITASAIASQACRDEFIDCNVQPKDITTAGFITFTNKTDSTEDLTVNVIRFELSANGTT